MRMRIKEERLAVLIFGLWVLFAVVLHYLAAADGDLQACPADGHAVVLRVIDGDTIDVVFKDEVERVRFYAIDAPETVHPRRKVEPFGPEAAELVKKLLPVGTAVRLEFEKHKRGAFCRMQAHVWKADILISAELVKLGLARVAEWDHEYKNKALLEELQKKAREAREGLWALVETPIGFEWGEP